MKSNKKGFTLVELVVVVAIIGILSAIAYPSYTQYVERSKRSEAMAALINAVQAMERFRATNYGYPESGSITQVYTDQVPVDGGDRYYTLSLSNLSKTTYTLTATPEGSMAGDGNLTITHTGARTWNGKACWPEGSNDCTP